MFGFMHLGEKIKGSSQTIILHLFFLTVQKCLTVTAAVEFVCSLAGLAHHPEMFQLNHGFKNKNPFQFGFKCNPVQYLGLGQMNAYCIYYLISVASPLVDTVTFLP